MMINLKPIFLLALFANITTVIAFIYMSSLGNNRNELQSLIFLLVIFLWLAVMLTALILSLTKRREIFKKGLTLFAILLLLCCTPVPLFTIWYYCRTPETVSSPAEYSNNDGKAFKTEKWYYEGKGKFVEKIFETDSVQASKASEDVTIVGDTAYAVRARNDSAYKPYGTWVYFKVNGDTLKTEYYKNGKLISTK